MSSESFFCGLVRGFISQTCVLNTSCAPLCFHKEAPPESHKKVPIFGFGNCFIVKELLVLDCPERSYRGGIPPFSLSQITSSRVSSLLYRFSRRFGFYFGGEVNYCLCWCGSFFSSFSPFFSPKKKTTAKTNNSEFWVPFGLNLLSRSQDGLKFRHWKFRPFLTNIIFSTPWPLCSLSSFCYNRINFFFCFLPNFF